MIRVEHLLNPRRDSLIVGRTLKPMFLPEVMAARKTDTWFSDPGTSMHDAHKLILRKALSDRATLRHADMREFADELLRSWRLVHNPTRRRADPEKEAPPWRKAVLPGVIIAIFVLIVLALLLFPVERIDAPDVPNVRPELSQ